MLERATVVRLTRQGIPQIETPIYERPIDVRLYLDAEETIKNFSCVTDVPCMFTRSPGLTTDALVAETFT